MGNGGGVSRNRSELPEPQLAVFTSASDICSAQPLYAPYRELKPTADVAKKVCRTNTGVGRP